MMDSTVMLDLVDLVDLETSGHNLQLI